MRKNEVTIVKQNSPDPTKKTREDAGDLKIKTDLHQNIADVVNDWISESRENRRAEKAFSVERISAWRLTSRSSNFR